MSKLVFVQEIYAFEQQHCRLYFVHNGNSSINYGQTKSIKLKTILETSLRLGSSRSPPSILPRKSSFAMRASLN